MTTNYEKGRSFEYRRLKYYREMGYECVRTSGSHGPVDLICFGFNEVIAVQCKIVQSRADCTRLVKTFRAKPFLPCKFKGMPVMKLDVYIRDERVTESVVL